MIINEDNFALFLQIIGFKIKEGEINTYSKEYFKFQYEIIIKLDKMNFKKSYIDYGNKIQIGRKTTCNFSQQENFVILECINRLLDKGYPPEKIILEKDWKLGHKEKGCLDIQILDENNNSFLMIECKTFEKEYDKERQKMYECGGQLFSYFVQDKTTKYLCLYTSAFHNNLIHYENTIIKITPEISKSNNQQEAFENWSPQVFEKRGIFEENIKPFLIKFSGLTKNDLKPLTKKDGGNIFNRFAEILRKNVVSDKTNAYNKIFNLFLCKIVDEYERNNEEKLQFQWEDEEDNITVLLRLNELYKRGMENYLNVHISSVDIEEFTNKLKYIKNENDKVEIKNLFIKQKLYTSNDFAFKEVFDEETFNSNCIVVKEVVKLLEEYKIKYETKQQFLGDFFEKLLNTRIKQESGQFFTPVPIAQFICKSLPIENIIHKKNENNEIHILPYVIDYASGAGHFLTEIMSEVDNIIQNNIPENFFKNQRAKKEFNNYKNNFDWAKEYVYGIEKDYRLAKTTKVATYLNGDGDAQIICGDGLDNFNKSKDYQGILKINNNSKDNECFDIVIANPPYAVSGFKTTLNYGKESFDLYDNFSVKSKEIECLFIERTKQLLKTDGVAGIILPNSVLTNTGIYTLTRELLLNNFQIKGIVEFSSNTFMATGTNTITLFLKKIENKNQDILYYLNKSIKEKKDLSINNIENPISKYLNQTYKINFNTYLEFFYNNDIDNHLKELNIYNEYLIQFAKSKEKTLSEFVTNKEIEKLLYFIITYNQKIVISNIPKDNRLEKDFLGYEFSTRRGHEGINIINLGGILYNPETLLDDTKVNYYILKNFLDEDLTSESNLENLKIMNLHECIDFKTTYFEKIININKKPEFKFKEEFEILKINECLETLESGNRPSGGVGRFSSGVISLGGEHIGLKGKILLNNLKYVPENYFYEAKQGILKDKDILICKDGALTGKVALFNENDLDLKPAMINEHVFLLRTNGKILQEYLFYYLYSYFGQQVLKSSITGQAQGGLNRPNILNIKIPLPEKKIQEEIIKELNSIEKKIDDLQEKNKKNENKINNILNESFNYGLKKLNDNNYIKDIFAGGDKPKIFSKTKTDECQIPIYSNGIENKGLFGFTNLERVNEPAVTLSARGTIGFPIKRDKPFFPIVRLIVIIPNLELLDNNYLSYILQITEINKSGSNTPQLTVPMVKDLEIPIPPKNKQKEIVEKIKSIKNEIGENLSLINRIDNEKNKILEKYLF